MTNPTDDAKIHWPQPFTTDLIRLRVAVTTTSDDTVSKMWSAHTKQVFRSWEVYAPMFSFSKFYEYSTGTPDIEVKIANYGATGWISQSEVDRNSQYHIKHGVIKLNAFYMSEDYSTHVPYAEGVYGHEFGHILGLKDNRPGILDGTPDDSCMNERGLLLGTASNRPNNLDTIALTDLYSHAEYALPANDHIWTEIIDSFPAP